MYASVHAHICVCVCRGQKLTSDVFLSLLNLLVETWSLTEPGTHLLARLAEPVSSGDLLVSSSLSSTSAESIDVCVSAWLLHMSAKNLHSGPRVWLQRFSLLCHLLSPTIPV